jgi:aspartate ammonia-lyase
MHQGFSTAFLSLLARRQFRAGWSEFSALQRRIHAQTGFTSTRNKKMSSFVAGRNEQDLLGERAVPAAAYYGVHTLRAIENFRITGTPISSYPDLIVALAVVKQAAATANHALGLLSTEHAEAIIAACKRLRAGELHEQFVVDVIQGGAGTSTNMNANEVIANMALEHLGHARGDYQVLHPNEHVNLSQSTNDVYPTALRLASYAGIFRLVAAMEVLKTSFETKALEFDDVLKMGRTQLQDAAQAWAKSICHRCRPARASCQAKSIQ